VPQDWLLAAGAYLSCSDFEGMPLGPIEAAGAGLPCVLSRIPGHEVLASASFGFELHQPADGARALETALAAAQGDHGTRIETAQALRARFSLEAMADTYVALYESGKATRGMPVAPALMESPA
jgi:glycosyltransferase involved in cell wall biosynthesis